MTFEQRMAELGVDLSDLPNCKHGMAYPASRYEKLLEEAGKYVGFKAPAGFEVFNAIQYALHLTDIIDRMETRLVNVTEELNHMNACDENHISYEFDGVPEDRRADDD